MPKPSYLPSWPAPAKVCVHSVNGPGGTNTCTRRGGSVSKPPQGPIPQPSSRTTVESAAIKLCLREPPVTDVPQHQTETMDTETRYRLLKLIEHNPGLSQRELAAELDASLGKVNYILRGLVDRGWVKVENFRRSDNKLAYLYRLTPQGLSQKTALALRFLRLKRAEHERLMTEIEVLRAEVDNADQTTEPGPETNDNGVCPP